MSLDFAVLASGAGTNLQALIDAGVPGLRAVLSDDPECGALDRAVAAGLPTSVAEYRGDRVAFTRRICDMASVYGAEALVLAGFMRVLGPEAIARFPNRIVNIHPSLLPAFPGLGAVGQALRHGVKVTGVTIHFVDVEVDHGPIIAQRAVPVLDNDTVESLHARIQWEEHDLYPRVVRALVEGRLNIENGAVVWS
ncbi:MAG: phosphoribosylglycinamide formyltransferase [Actinomycetota bacterium]